MATIRKLDKVRVSVFRVSSSIANWKEKLRKRIGLKEWTWRDIFKFRAVIFFGCYHPIDYVCVLLQRGRRTIFWCGSDILHLQKSIWRYIIPKLRAKHYCENEIEQRALQKMQINAEIRPMIFDDPNKFEISFKPSQNPQVWMCARDRYKHRYGLDFVERIAYQLPEIIFHIYGISRYPQIINNIRYHGEVPEAIFNEQIKTYHAGLRLNSFDGFSEVLAKSILLGQYPISCIPYEMISCAENENKLIDLLKELKNKKTSNTFASNWWREYLETNLCRILSIS